MTIDFHDLTAITDALKRVYGEGITEQFNDESLTYHQFPKSTRKPRGLGYYFSIRYARAQGTGARGESQKLPDPLVGKFDQGTISPKYIYGSLRLTGPMIEAAKGDMAAFVEGQADAMDDIYQSLIVDLNRMAHSDGFGHLATLSEASDALTDSGTTTWTITCDNDTGVMYLQEGQLVDFYDGAAVDQSSVASRISSVDAQNKTAEMEVNDGTYKANHPISGFSSYTIATDAVPDGAYVVKMGTRDASHATTDTYYEMMGLNGIFDDGTLLASFEGITVASYPKWKANILGNSSVNRELSIDLMLQALDVSRTMYGPSGMLTMRMGLGQRRKYANLLLPDVRFAPAELKGGYETLTFAGGDGRTKIVVDPMTRPNKIFIHPEGAIEKYEMMPLGWLDRDQKIHMRAGYDEWDMVLGLYTNLGTERRNACTLIKDLVEPGLWS